VIGNHVRDDVVSQLRFRPKPDIGGNPPLTPADLVVQLRGRYPDSGTDQGVSPKGRVAAVHRVHPVRDPPGTPHVLAFRPGGGLALCRARGNAEEGSVTLFSS
jgi:hypothetical protein